MNVIKRFYRYKESTVATIIVLLVIGLTILIEHF